VSRALGRGYGKVCTGFGMYVTNKDGGSQGVYWPDYDDPEIRRYQAARRA
jgi:hypothetical protein